MTTNYYWDFSVLLDNVGLLRSGLITTLAISAISCIAGSIIAIPMAVGLGSKHAGVRVPLLFATESLRSIPLLVLLVWIYYVFPVSLGIAFSAFWTSTLALSINLAAFLADILRGGVKAIPIGHIEAAEALGLSRYHVLVRVIIPETVRRTLPTISSYYISALKLSTLASVIGAKDIMFASRILNAQSPHPFEVYSFLAVAFMVIILPASWLSRHLELHSWFALFPKSK